MKTKHQSPLAAFKPIALFLPLGTTNMRKVNLGDFYAIGSSIGRLRELKAGQASPDDLGTVSQAQDFIHLICKHNKHLVPLQVCIPSATLLAAHLDSLFDKLFTGACNLSEFEITHLNELVANFETVFREETKTIATYFVASKRNYSTQSLIEQAEMEFSEQVLKRLTKQCVIDIKNAGKCIALEIATAAGIHSFRALEAAALDYVAKRNLTPPKRDLYTYFDMLEKDGADAKVIQVGQQLRSLRRNPLAHPEDNLDLDEAIEAFQLCTTAITALIRDMEKRKLFPT